MPTTMATLRAKTCSASSNPLCRYHPTAFESFMLCTCKQGMKCMPKKKGQKKQRKKNQNGLINYSLYPLLFPWEPLCILSLKWFLPKVEEMEVWKGSVQKIATLQYSNFAVSACFKVRGDPLNAEG